MKGSPGGPGQGWAKALIEKKMAVQQAFTNEDIIKVMQAVLEDALNSADPWVKLANRTIYLSYMLGKPSANITIDKTETVTTVDMKAFSDDTLRAIDALTHNPELAQKVLAQEGEIVITQSS